jgi:hypothetical protein
VAKYMLSAQPRRELLERLAIGEAFEKADSDIWLRSIDSIFCGSVVSHLVLTAGHAITRVLES